MQSFNASSPVSGYNRFALPCRGALALAFAVFTAALFPALGKSQTTLSSYEDVPNVQQDVFFRGIDQHIYFRYYNRVGGFQVQDVTTLSGAPLAAPATAVTSFNDDAQNQQHVVFEAADGHIYQAYSNANPSVWAFQDITSITGAGGAAIATPLVSYCDPVTDIQYVFFLGLNQDVNLFYWHNGWMAEDASSVAGAIPAVVGSAMTGFYEAQRHNSHIFYEGVDQHIHELYANLDPTAISKMDNTADSGATLAAVGSALSGNFDNAKSQENVYFVGIDQHIHHLTFTYPGTDWQSEDVTSLSRSLPASLGSSLSSFGDAIGNQQHIFFIGIDQHVHQFFYGSSWAPDDVTADTGAPIPALNSPLTTFKDDPDSQQHAFYLGADNHFYHFWFDTLWHFQDLTSGAPAPAI